MILLDDVSVLPLARQRILYNYDAQVLAALDVHTSRWIVDTCFKGELLSGRTVILVVG